MRNVGKVLLLHGWRAIDETSWKHPQRSDEEIVVGPTGWVHVKADIKAKHDKTEIAKGTTKDLEAYLVALSKPAA